jgi:hypothetical protein
VPGVQGARTPSHAPLPCRLTAPAPAAQHRQAGRGAVRRQLQGRGGRRAAAGRGAGHVCHWQGAADHERGAGGGGGRSPARHWPCAAGACRQAPTPLAHPSTTPHPGLPPTYPSPQLSLRMPYTPPSTDTTTHTTHTRCPPPCRRCFWTPRAPSQSTSSAPPTCPPSTPSVRAGAGQPASRSGPQPCWRCVASQRPPLKRVRAPHTTAAGVRVGQGGTVAWPRPCGRTATASPGWLALLPWRQLGRGWTCAPAGSAAKPALPPPSPQPQPPEPHPAPNHQPPAPGRRLQATPPTA